VDINKYEEKEILFTQNYIEQGDLLFNILQVQCLLIIISE